MVQKMIGVQIFRIKIENQYVLRVRGVGKIISDVTCWGAETFEFFVYPNMGILPNMGIRETQISRPLNISRSFTYPMVVKPVENAGIEDVTLSRKVTVTWQHPEF